MAQKEKSAQRSRDHKESGRSRKSSRGVRLTELQKVLIGGGAYARMKPWGAGRGSKGRSFDRSKEAGEI